jgi:hypothetical protein
MEASNTLPCTPDDAKRSAKENSDKMFNTANWVSFCADYLELESFGLAINSI